MKFPNCRNALPGWPTRILNETDHLPVDLET